LAIEVLIDPACGLPLVKAAAALQFAQGCQKKDAFEKTGLWRSC
jgi:hypothetical protein